jgi:hypothetical protein
MGEAVSTTAGAPAVVFTCVWCGKPITLSTSPSGEEIADAKAFLADHGSCLKHYTPERDDRRPGRGTVVLPP